jgi:hypothetical protein
MLSKSFLSMNDLEITSKKKKELLKIQKELPPNLKGKQF